MNYADEVTVYGMLPAYASLVEGEKLVAWKNKKQDAIISFDPSFQSNCAQVSYMYIDEAPDKSKFEGVYKCKQLVNGVFDEQFFKFTGEKGRHFRESRNKYDKKMEMKVGFIPKLEDVLDLVLKWEQLHGKKKYRMQMHSSYDKKFFRENVQKLKDKVDIFTFWDSNELIGYKVVEKQPIVHEGGLLEFKSLLRKYDPSYSHVCLYVDLKAYMWLWEQHQHKPFVVNVGCSSGGVASYKKEKFPIYSEEVKWFYKSKSAKGIQS